MDTGSLILMGLAVLFLWLHAIFYNRIQSGPAPWDRWFVVPEYMNRTFKGLSIGVAIVVSVLFGMILVAAVAG